MPQSREELQAKRRKYYQNNKEYFQEYQRTHLPQRRINNSNSKKKVLKNMTEKTRKRISDYQKALRIKIKLEVLGFYSKGKPTCAICKEDRMECLTIDHINGGGRKHRKEIGCESKAFYSWLKRNNYPLGYRVLCMNCQWVTFYHIML